MNRTIFYSASAHRQSPYAVETEILKMSAGNKVIKRAISHEALDHVANIAKTGDALNKLPLAKLAKIVPAKLGKDGSLSLPFIAGRSVERLLVEAITNKDETTTFKIIDRLIEMIGALPTQKVNPMSAGYKKLFGDYYNKQLLCITPGLIDLSLDNFIVDKKGTWHLFDYEWAFAFPIPKQYVIQRFFYYFFIKRFQQLVLLSGKHNHLVKLAPGIYVPKNIYDRYRSYFGDLQRLEKTELFFQKKIHHQLPTSPAVKWLNKPLLASANEVKHASDSIDALQAYSNLQLEYQTLLHQYKVASDRLEAITSTKAYKLAAKARRTTRKFTGK